MTNPFDYLLDRVREAEFEQEPFPHLYIRNFLSDADFKAITTSEDVDFPVAPDIEGLFRSLEKATYEAISFPGCTKSKSDYLDWVREPTVRRGTHAACEARGMAFRLQRPHDDTNRALDTFFRSQAWQDLLRERFAITQPTEIESGMQKYLHGYEISPHPDIRRKALTWMLNINPAPNSEELGFHTHYLRFKPQWSFVPEFWRYNPSVETCWVPWDWCSTVSQQTENNSVVMFSPRWDTVHAIRAHYDHLVTQRTQMYGNLWYEGDKTPPGPQFQDFDLVRRVSDRSTDGGRPGYERATRRAARTVKKAAQRITRR